MAQKEYDLGIPQDLFDFLTDANIRLVRGAYLRHLAREKRLWPRRQEAQHETFQDEDGSVKTALVTLEEYKQDQKNIIFSVSHCWEAKQHPDPFAFQARELVPKLLGADCWVFVDYICLPQYYRTAEEQVFFKKAMGNMHLLYTHLMVLWVVRLEQLADESVKASPPDFIDIYFEEVGAEPGSGKFGPQPFSKLELNDTPYHERGWCVAERQWVNTKMYIEGFAPMTPARFRERVQRGHQQLPDGLVLKFTHRSDEEIVVKLQETIFAQQAAERKILRAKGLPEAELLLLAESLPHFVNLKQLRFANLEIGEVSAVALIAGLKPLRHLNKLILPMSCRMEEKAAMVLAHGLLDCRFDGELEVFVDFGVEKLVNELRSLTRTGRVYEASSNAFFTIKAAGSKSGCLGRLGRCCKRRATEPPRASLDDAHVVAHV